MKRNSQMTFLLLGVVAGAVMGYGVGRPSIPSTLWITKNMTNTVRPEKGSIPLTISPTLRPETPLDWRDVESTNYPTYIQNLRRIGCPDITIRDIIVADVRALYEARRREQAGLSAGSYWQSSYGRDWNPEQHRVIERLEDEEREVLERLLGQRSENSNCPSIGEAMGSVLNADGALLSKKEVLVSWKLKYADLTRELLASAGEGQLTEQDQEALDEILRDRDEELQSLLSPTELEEYELRNSVVADELRRQLRGTAVNESEFRALFRERKALDERLDNALTSGTREDASAAQALFAQAAAAILGPERSRHLVQIQQEVEM